MTEPAATAAINFVPSGDMIRPASKRLLLSHITPESVAGLFLALLYTRRYLDYPALPGNDPNHPGGWWGWSDQSHFLQSAGAFANGDLDPVKHFYPLGYPLLGAPFMPGQHPFFFVDLAALLIAFTAFISFARRCGASPRLAAALFILAAAGDWALFQQWVVPWNTTPVAAATWVLLALAAAHLDGIRRPALLGLSAVCIAILRPTDALITAVPIAACLLADSRASRLRWRDVLAFCVSAGLPAVAYITLHLCIYGPHRTAYMALSSHIGFTLHRIDIKAYTMLIDPSGWIGSGEGLSRRCPWLVLGIAGLVPAFSRPKTLMLACALMVHGGLYLAYADLTPMGLWRYLNVHYYTWVFPGFALLAAFLIRDLIHAVAGQRILALAGLSAVSVLLCVRFDPVPASPGQSVQAVDLPVQADFQGVYLGPLSITDARGTLSDGADIRGVALPGSVRVLAIKRSLVPPIAASFGGSPVAASGLHARLRLGIPFLPWSTPGEFGPR